MKTKENSYLAFVRVFLFFHETTSELNVIQSVSQRTARATQVSTYYRTIHHLLDAVHKEITQRTTRIRERKHNTITRTSLNASIDSHKNTNTLFLPPYQHGISSPLPTVYPAFVEKLQFFLLYAHCLRLSRLCEH